MSLPSVNEMFGSLRGFMAAVRASLFDNYEDQGARDLLTLAAVERAFVAVAGADLERCQASDGRDTSMTGQKGATTPQLDPDSLELAPGTEHENLEGWIPALGSDAEVLDALEKAFDYRGDVTITCKDGSVIEGYIFDRRTGASLDQSWVRLFPEDSPEKRSIAYSEIAGLNLLARTVRPAQAGKLGEEVERKEGGRRKRFWPTPRST